MPEDVNDHDTADGRPATVAAAHARLARMLGADTETSTPQERLDYASSVHARLLQVIVEGLVRVAARLPSPPERLLLSGSGEFLARAVLRREQMATGATVRSLNQEQGPDRSTAACAYAVAVLNQEREG